MRLVIFYDDGRTKNPVIITYMMGDDILYTEEFIMNEDYLAIKRAKEKMDKTVGVLKSEFVNIRAGRANPKILDKIVVNYYGTPTPITQIGNVSTPEPRVLLISLWDAGMLKEAEKAIQTSDLGINPSNDGKNIRLVFPEPTAERRKELCKVARKKAEDSKVAIRAIRRDANEVLKKDKKNSVITEDDLTELEEEIQKVTDDCIKLIDSLLKEKESEIMEL